MMPDENGLCRVCSGPIDEAPTIPTAPTPAQRAAESSTLSRKIGASEILCMRIGLACVGVGFAARLLLPTYIVLVLGANIVTRGDWLSLQVVEWLIVVIAGCVAVALCGQTLLFRIPSPAIAKSSLYGAAAFQLVGLASYVTSVWLHGTVSVQVHAGCAFFVVVGQILFLTFLRGFLYARGEVARSHTAAKLCRTAASLLVAVLLIGAFVNLLLNSFFISLFAAVFGWAILAAVVVPDWVFVRSVGGLLLGSSRAVASQGPR